MNGKWKRTAAMVLSLLMCMNFASPMAMAAEEEGILTVSESQEYVPEEETEMQTEEASTENDDDGIIMDEAEGGDIEEPDVTEGSADETAAEDGFPEGTLTDDDIAVPVVEEETDDGIIFLDEQGEGDDTEEDNEKEDEEETDEDQDEDPDGIPIDESTFPDDFFRSYVEENFDLDGSKTLSEEERLAVKKISFPNYTSYYPDNLFQSLEGIQYFTELEYLDCSGNKLSGEVDLSGLSKLTYLDCCSNYNANTGYIWSLNLEGDTSLQELYCYNNLLFELDLSDCASSLTVLNCENNFLLDLDVSGCKNLITLYCGSNLITTLDVRGLSKLNWLSCYNSYYDGDYYVGLKELILDGNDSMTVLKCDWNSLTELDLSACPNLKTLTTVGYQLYGLDVSGLKDLQTLECSANYLGSLDLSNNPELYHLEYCEMDLTELDITNNPEIVNLDCSYNSITELDLNSQETIRTIDISGQELGVTAFASDDKLVVSLEGLVKPENIDNVTPVDPDVTLEGNYLIIPDVTADEVVYNYETKFGDMDVHLYIEDTVKVDISSCTVMLSPESFDFDGAEHLPEITVMDGERVLTEGVDYTVAYPDDMDNTNAGDIEFSIIGEGFYTGEQSCEFTIDKAVYDMSGVSFTDITYTYDGAEHVLEITGELPDGVEVSYSENALTDVGVVEVTASFTSADENYYPIDDMTATLEILPATFTVIKAEGYTGIYDGEGHSISVKLTGDVEGAVITYSTSADGEYTDVNPAFTEAGKYTVFYKVSKENYNDLIGSLTVEIKPANIADMPELSIKLSGDDFTYDGKAKTPAVTVALPDGTKLTDGIDYTVTYKENVEAGTATVIVKFIGNYTGTETLTFTIKEAESEAESESETETESETVKESESESESETETASAVQTGDNTPITSLTLLFLAAGVCFILLVLQRREHEHGM